MADQFNISRNSNLKIDVVRKLKEYRVSNALSKEDMAEMLGISPEYYSSVEDGWPIKDQALASFEQFLEDEALEKKERHEESSPSSIQKIKQVAYETRQKEIADQIRNYRVSSRKTQAYMAKIFNISQQQYSVLESGKQIPTIDFVVKFKAHTGITLVGELENRISSIPPDLVTNQLLAEKERLIEQLKSENEFLRSLLIKKHS